MQGFLYDLRTAILPFMFIFNTHILLVGVTAWWEIAYIFGTTLIAMFAFAAFTQHFMVRRNKLYESILLVVTMLILLRPDWIGPHYRDTTPSPMGTYRHRPVWVGLM